MQWILALVLALVVHTDAPADAPDTDAMLAMLDERGDDLQTLTADVTLTRIDGLAGNQTTRTGKLWYDDRGETPMFRVSFGDRQEDGNTFPGTASAYVLRGNVLEERDYGNKRIIYRKLADEGETVDLFALGTGPLPLPIGQDPAEVKKIFDIGEVEGEGPELPNFALLPKPETDIAKRMLAVELWVDPALKLPTQVVVVEVDGSLQEMTLANVVLNQDIPGENFNIETPDESEWEIRDE